MDGFQSFPADFARVDDKTSDHTAFGVGGVCLDPSSMRWKASPYSAVDEGLDSCSWCCELVRGENFTVLISDKCEIGVDLFEEPCRGTSWNCSAQAEFVRWL